MKRFLAFDTRRLIIPSDTLFFALAGKGRDGHDYIPDAYRQGVRHFVVRRGFDARLFADAKFEETDDVLQHLQDLAAAHREQHDLRVIGITGSNGKTIVKEWLNYLLTKIHHHQVVCSPKSYNSQIGVPLSLWEIQPHHRIGIFEAGISTVGEMPQLARMIACNVGIFTNIGSAHDEGFSSRAEKIAEKSALFEPAETIIYNADYADIEQHLKARFADKTLKTWSQKNTAADLFLTEITRGNYTRIEGIYEDEILHIEIPYSDKASIENAVHCWLTLLALGYRAVDFLEAFRHLPPVALRLSHKAALNDCTLIDDSYSLDLNSLSIALDFLMQQKTHDKTTIILSDVPQTGLSPEVLYAKVAERLNQKRINRFIGIGSEILAIRNALNPETETAFFATTEDFLKNFKPDFLKKESILLKGARAFGFERIARALERQLHQAVLEVNLEALADNLKVYRSALRPATRLMAMVKAAAYGSGIVEIAQFLAHQKVDYLAVAYTDEGLKIRDAGIDLPILVLNPEVSTFERLILNDLEPEIYSFLMLENFVTALKNTKMLYPAAVPEIYPIHLKLDTGMKRLGFERSDLPQLQRVLRDLEGVKVQSIFSHLVGSDAAQHDDFTRHQIQNFQEMAAAITETLQYQPLRHILNSSGIARFPEFQLDMVRLGVGLYGIGGTPDVQAQLKNISTLKASIAQIKTVRKGETVGYNRVGVATKDLRIATVGIGYADGFARALSNGRGEMYLHGKYAPVIGNVCMDMTMIDISDIPEAQVGDTAEIFGSHLSIQTVAQRLQTIPYEVLTNISERVKRVYFVG